MALNENFQNIVRSWILQHGRFDAIFRTMLLPDAEDQDTEIANEAFAAKLLITPTSASASNIQVIVDIASRAYQNRTVCFTPMLTFRAMIPSDSEVFHVVKGGSVTKLKKLLSSGAASLGDCDSMGRSLLNVSLCEKLNTLHRYSTDCSKFALYKCRRKMTRFLIQLGADVDTLEPQVSRCFDDTQYDPTINLV